MKPSKTMHRAHPGRRLEQAVRELWECAHRKDQIQQAQTRVEAASVDFIRCVDCGAVAYADDGFKRWTRPTLVAHVIGALS